MKVSQRIRGLLISTALAAISSLRNKSTRIRPDAGRQAQHPVHHGR